MTKLSRFFEKLRYIYFFIRVNIADEYGKARIYSKFFGVKMGLDVRITGMLHFPSEAFLIEIGSNVTLTKGIIFHTHDGGVGVFREEFPGINVFGRIVIGNNVFIGSNTTILPNVVIGSDVVIGASSVVTKDVPEGVVVAGNPARIISSLDEYKRKVLNKAIYVPSSNSGTRIKQITSQLLESDGKIENLE